MTSKCLEREAERLARELVEGEMYECGSAVVYGWRVGSKGCPADEAADVLLRQRDEIARLKKIVVATKGHERENL